MNNVAFRENIETWAADSPKLYQFRRGIEEMQKLSDQSLMDERGYQWCAGVHGGFGGAPYCEHGTLDFVTWHRPYLLDFETKLRDQIARFAGQQAAEEWRIPYWNWASRFTKGIPKAFTDKTYKDGNTTKPNPLLSMPYQLPFPANAPVEKPGQSEDHTFRNKGTLAALKNLREPVIRALDKSQFAASNGFSRSIEQPHNGLHVWAMGFMVTLRSSFDPIFWCHHANVDRQWWIWQQKFGNSSIPQAQRDFTCRPFQFTDNRAEAFFDTRALGYEYTGSTLNVSLADLPRLESAPGVKPKDSLCVSLGAIKSNFDEAQLHINGVRHTEDTYQIHVYANKKTATIKTPKTAKSGFLGTLTVLGHGQCPGADGHCELRTTPKFSGDLRAPHHLAPFDLTLDVSAGINQLAKATKSKGTGKIHITLVVVGMDGKQKPSSVIQFDNIQITSD